MLRAVSRTTVRIMEKQLPDWQRVEMCMQLLDEGHGIVVRGFEDAHGKTELFCLYAMDYDRAGFGKALQEKLCERRGHV